MLNLSNAPGVMQAINAAGYVVEQRDNNLFGVRVSDGATGEDVDNAISQIDLNYPVSAAADYVCKIIDEIATSKRNKVIAPYSPGEMAAWPIKRDEALTYQSSGSTSDAPNLDAEAASRGMSLQTLVTKVLNDAAKFSWIEAHIAGTSGRHRDAIRLCQTHEEIMNYNYNTGWPV